MTHQTHMALHLRDDLKKGFGFFVHFQGKKPLFVSCQGQTKATQFLSHLSLLNICTPSTSLFLYLAWFSYFGGLSSLMFLFSLVSLLLCSAVLFPLLLLLPSDAVSVLNLTTPL